MPAGEIPRRLDIAGASRSPQARTHAFAASPKPYATCETSSSGADTRTAQYLNSGILP